MASISRPRSASLATGGTLTKATLSCAGRMGLENETLARVLGLKTASISRMRNDAHTLKPGSKPAELAVLLIRVCNSLDALLGSSEPHLLLWISAYNRAINATPKDAIQSAQGLVRVLTHLDRAASNA